MQSLTFSALVIGILLSIIGITFLTRPRPKYVPKITYRVIMRRIGYENAVRVTRLYGAISLAVGIFFLILWTCSSVS